MDFDLSLFKVSIPDSPMCPGAFVVGADVTCVGPMVLIGACRFWQKGRVVFCDRKDQSPCSCRE